jgi:isoquinoline 1-oxidoreductase subunit beta
MVVPMSAPEDTSGTHMTKHNGTALSSRRRFILSTAAAGGGMAIGLPTWLFEGASRPTWDGGFRGVEVYNWIVVAPDNTITMRIAQTEMGQGTMTAMAQLLAEELEVKWSKVRTAFISITADVARTNIYGRTDTVGGEGVGRSQLLLRTCGAQIRTMFLQAASKRFGVPESELAAKDSAIIHSPTGRKLTYGELALDAAKVVVPDPNSVKLKRQKDWTCIGKSVERVDIPSKVNGTAIFGIDVRLPGMKHAAIAMSPVFGGKLKSYDARAALSRHGVSKVIEIAGNDAGIVDAVAVVADDWWQAKIAIDAMPKEWDGGEWSMTESRSLLADLQGGLARPADKILRNTGDVEVAMQSAAQIFEATYFVPYLEHATMEPINCTAVVTQDGFEVWAPTQLPVSALKAAAAAAGVPEDKGKLHVTQLGGGFGRRQKSDFVVQAVNIAKAIHGTPVKLLWTREDTMRHGFYRPMCLSRARGGLDASGGLIAWSQRIVAPSDDPVFTEFGAYSLLYAIPNMRVDLVVKQSCVREGPLRGVGFGMHSFTNQCFMDELARAAGRDTYECQRALLDPDRTPADVPPATVGEQLTDDISPSTRAARLRAVLDEAAEKAGWRYPLAPSRGRGIAAQELAGGFYAVVVEVTLDAHAWFKVDRIVVVGDPGLLANPDNATAQIQGAIAFGLTSAIYGEITLKNGRVVEGNFDDYQLLRVDEMPEVEVHWILGGQFWGDVAQSVTTIIPPALTNAIYDAGGPVSDRFRSRTTKSSDARLVGCRDRSKNMVNFTVNGTPESVDVRDDMPLLWVLRDVLGLTGTKYGCGVGACGACIVHINGVAEYACLTPITSVAGKIVTTIEGLSPDGQHPIQRAWVAEQVPQCGYCQSGQIMRAAAFLDHNKSPTRAEIVYEMRANLCRCGTYLRIIRAIERASSRSVE